MSKHRKDNLSTKAERNSPDYNTYGQFFNRRKRKAWRLGTITEKQRLINKMTNWQRKQWAKSTKKGSKIIKGYRPDRIEHFLALNRR